MAANGNRFVLHEMSSDYGERRWAVEDLAIMRDNLVRHWRQRGQGRVTAQGIRPPKTGMIWRGTEDEATRLCEALNKAAKLGTLTVASDPPVRENARHYAKTGRATSKRGTTTSSHMKTQASLFTLCEKCRRMHKGDVCP